MPHSREGIMKKLAVSLLRCLLLFSFLAPEAHALPAFGIREHVSCVMCHENGSAPHLTRIGYLYRRAGFRFPEKIGDVEADAKETNFTEHLAVGLNLDYEWANATPPGGKATTTANQINVPEVELWPLVGAFLGNYAFWSEIDANPATTGGGQVVLSQADFRYVRGNSNLFFNFRGGMIAPEGFGASDQSLDDGGIPLMDRLSANYNQDTLTLPFGAMQAPELGAEFGLNVADSHVTFGVYDGYSGVDSTGSTSTSLTPALMNRNKGIAKDYKLQIDQFIANLGAVTASYYNGVIPLRDPTGGSFSWLNHYSQERLYLTAFALPGTLDLFLGGALAKNQYVTLTPTPDGTFQSRGSFLGLNYYVMPHLSLGARLDYCEISRAADSAPKARGYSFQVSLPYENNLYVFHYNSVTADAANGPYSAGTDRDLRAEWRFLF
jgi:hypothetical protein